eukprot:864302-Prymnesium_polylepis.2
MSSIWVGAAYWTLGTAVGNSCRRASNRAWGKAPSCSGTLSDWCEDASPQSSRVWTEQLPRSKQRIAAGGFHEELFGNFKRVVSQSCSQFGQGGCTIQDAVNETPDKWLLRYDRPMYNSVADPRCKVSSCFSLQLHRSAHCTMKFELKTQESSFNVISTTLLIGSMVTWSGVGSSAGAGRRPQRRKSHVVTRLWLTLARRKSRAHMPRQSGWRSQNV